VNAPIRRLSTVVALLFSALLISSTFIQFVQAKQLQDRPDNRRTLLANYARERGQILVDGTPVAKSTATKDELKWLRIYPHGELYSHITGYYSFTYGAGGGVELPFGGYKKSGYGREKGLESLASYTQVKNVCIKF
jgi:peptidoglycan glycosyltransferase